jgi:uncharacterized damage-inducible protein DinB
MQRHIATLVLAGGLLAPLTALAVDASIVPPPGLRADIVANLRDASGKVVELAGAMPAKKWTWRPMKGVRSVAEVNLHLAASNYFLAAYLGAKPPMPLDDLQKLEGSGRSPAETERLLRESFEFVEAAIAAVPDAELGEAVTLFGRPSTKQNVMLAALSHAHEHLGQAIAYARTCGVVPPWTARAQAAAAAKKAGGE